MNKENFVKVINYYKELQDNIDKYYEFGIELCECPHSVIGPIESIVDIMFDSIYNQYGVDWINWFIYENDFGRKELEAKDGDELICQTVEDLYDYIEQYKK